MEVKIGVQNVAREITFETDASAEEVVTSVTAAVENGTALMLIATPDAVPAEVIDSLRGAPGILSVHSLSG